MGRAGLKQVSEKHGVKSKSARTGYVTRSKAANRLGLSLREFRTMCILKGVFPRVPEPGAKLSLDHIYYFRKDLSFIRQDPAVQVLATRKATEKKIAKALKREDKLKARTLAQAMPEIDYALIIRNRYPNFAAALEDMDDALCTVALFASCPSQNSRGVKASTVRQCRRLMDYWNLMVTELGLLRRTFVSIKGFYYQAHVCGTQIMWLVPHEFPTALREDVIDVTVLATFADLYMRLVEHIMLKIYKTCGAAYPPPLRNPNKTEGQNAEAQKVEGESTAEPPLDARFLTYSFEVGAENQGRLLQAKEKIAGQTPDDIIRRELFEKQVFYVSRETPCWHMLFVLRAAGCRLFGFDESLTEYQASTRRASPLLINDSRITHHVVDRPVKAMGAILKSIGVNTTIDLSNASSAMSSLPRIFIQPQWVFDSFNTGAHLPTAPYIPGVVPPPHLSPFLDEQEEEELIKPEHEAKHVPEQRRVLVQWSKTHSDALASAAKQKLSAAEKFDLLATDHDALKAVVETHSIRATSQATPQASEEASEEVSESPETPETAETPASAAASAAASAPESLDQIALRKKAKQEAEERERARVSMTRKTRKRYEKVREVELEKLAAEDALKAKAAALKTAPEPFVVPNPDISKPAVTATKSTVRKSGKKKILGYARRSC